MFGIGSPQAVFSQPFGSGSTSGGWWCLSLRAGEVVVHEVDGDCGHVVVELL
jgi:hypothetical protein